MIITLVVEKLEQANYAYIFKAHINYIFIHNF